MKRWIGLSPSATVGEEISVDEAGHCLVCDQAWTDGDAWCPVALYENGVPIAERSGAVHSWCSGSLKDES